MAARRRLVGLFATICALLAACAGESSGVADGDDDDDDDESAISSEDDEDEVSQRKDAGRGRSDGGASRSDAGKSSSRDGGSMVPGTMPPPPDDMAPSSRDAGSRSARDGSAPTMPSGGSTDISSCTPPPAEATPSAVKAWTMLNELRLAAGAGCMNMVPELMKSAQSHCDYRAMHRGNTACLTSSAHNQVMGCAGFTGANVQAREIAAGYPRNLAYTEVALSYGDNPMLAIPGWLVTPFHRIPMIDPWTTDMGWGGGPGCDIIDFGRGMVDVPNDTVVVFPYDGQTEVPVSFNGLEAPQPPPPAGGWPSSYPVSVYAQKLQITEHVLTKDGSDTPLEHTWLDTMNPGNAGLRPYFGNTAMLYGAPFEPDTTYHVKIVGTYVGGQLDRSLSFKTSAKKPGRF